MVYKYKLKTLTAKILKERKGIKPDALLKILRNKTKSNDVRIWEVENILKELNQ